MLHFFCSTQPGSKHAEQSENSVAQKKRRGKLVDEHTRQLDALELRLVLATPLS
jgi:hypothetical protein